MTSPAAAPRRAAAVAVAVAVGIALAASACSSSTTATVSAGGAATTTGTVTVFAASSLLSAFTELGKQFEAAHPGTTVTFDFGASSALAQQILAGAPADVFASASGANMKQVTDSGDAMDPQPFATNKAEIAVAVAAADKVQSLADLAKPGLKVALCQQQVPCGALAHTVLGNAKVTLTPVTEGLDVKSTLAYVTSGEADAAIVFATDVLAAGNGVKGVEIPAAVNASTSYPIAVVKGSRNATLAHSFEDFVLSAAGRKVLTDAGFGTP
jgi:molybdate transport system substrate-binding protein